MKQIQVNPAVGYRLLKKRGVKSLRLSFYPMKGFVVTAPKWYPFFLIERFIQDHLAWMIQKQKEYPHTQSAFIHCRKEYVLQKEKAKEILEPIVQQYCKLFDTTYQKISIRNQSSRWGSCSMKKNLSFHYKVAQLPEHLRDYIVVHEICHLKQMNHSVQFWSLVSMVMPDYKTLRKELRLHTPRAFLGTL